MQGSRTGAYISPPADSPYHDPSSLGALVAQIKESDRAIVLGDLNARVGQLPRMDVDGKVFEYHNVKDFIVNDIGKAVKSM